MPNQDQYDLIQKAFQAFEHAIQVDPDCSEALNALELRA